MRGVPGQLGPRRPRPGGADLTRPLRPVYASQGYTVELRRKGWHFTGYHVRGDKPVWRGPCRSEASVTLTIARELLREIRRRCPAAARRTGEASTDPPSPNP